MNGYIDKPRRFRRRTLDDNLELAQPKPGMRIRNEAVLAEVRARPNCERCGRPTNPADPHHISTRGAGGGDVPGNVVSLCRDCHQFTHCGLVSKAELRDLVAQRKLNHV